MIFHSFLSQEERRKYGGSCFIELQYCNLPEDAGIEELVSVNNIHHWENESLYIHGDDENEFFSWYKDIFTCGMYSNGKKGRMDLCGINYYSGEQVKNIVKMLQLQQPPEYQTLLHWLKLGCHGKGFYILGI